jgi:Kef-type K+ transport system membrane component KefB
MEPIGFHGILILLGVAVVLVALFRYLRLPQILAYLCAGIVVGPYGMGWTPTWKARAPSPSSDWCSSSAGTGGVNFTRRIVHRIHRIRLGLTGLKPSG